MHPRELRAESSNPLWQTRWEYLCHEEMVDQRPFQPAMEHLENSSYRSKMQHTI